MGYMHGEKAAADLEKLLLDPQQDHRMRLLAARALGHSGCKRSSQALVCALDDGYPSVRHGAIAALGAIGNRDACPALMRLLDNESCHVRGAAARSLIQICGIPAAEKGNIGLLTRLLCSGDIRIKDSLLRAGLPAIAALSSMLDSDSFSARLQAAQTLALLVRRTADRLPPDRGIFSWLEGQGIPAKSICRLYSFRMAREGMAVTKVENSGFDSISMILCGLMPLHLHAPLKSPSASKPDHIWEAHVEETMEPESITFEGLLSRYGAQSPRLMGRTIVAPMAKGCLAIKLCVNDGDEIGLRHEAKMQRMLQGLGLYSRIPQPQGGLLRIEGLPSRIEADIGLYPRRGPVTGRSGTHGICYVADSDYFLYLSDPHLSEEEMRCGLMSCAYDLGRLAGEGLIHRSLIPLFHKRERAFGQGGDYRWNRKLAGCLDNWMESCRFPNLRLSGIADLEHMEVHPKVLSQSMQAYAGEHLFSMSLVLGCYFCRRGTSGQKAMSDVLEGCFKEYYCALTGSDHGTLDAGIDWNCLARRMAEEMVAEKMDDRGADDRAGAADEMHLHLGLHNGPFPIPELLRAIHISSTFAVLELQSRPHDPPR